MRSRGVLHGKGTPMTTEERIAEILRAPYARIFQHDPESDVYTATVLEMPGVITEGEGAEEANRMLEEAMAGWVEIELERGHDIPKPLAERNQSGSLSLRLGPALHERAVMLAAEEGISLNRWLSAAVAAYSGERAVTKETGGRLSGARDWASK